MLPLPGQMPPSGGMDQEMDPQMLAAIFGGAGPGQPPPGGEEEGAGGLPKDPLDASQQVIQDLYSLISVLPDANHTQMATQALGILTKIQKDLMSDSGQGAASGPGY